MRIFLFFTLLFLPSLLKAQSANDCVNAIPVCGDSNFGLEPDGVGVNEFSLPGNLTPSCHTFNTNTIWFIISIVESGELTFDIIPDNASADYDFAVFGPTTDCENLGQAIRCSSTNPAAAGVSALTGLNSTEIDTSEGPGSDGNGYLSAIDAVAGETYFLLIDRAIGEDGFSINITGTAGFPEQPIAFDVQNLSSCDNDGVVDGAVTYNFSPLVSQIENGQQNVIVSFHASLNDANLNINPLPQEFTNNSNPQTIYYRITNTLSGCSDINNFQINTTIAFTVSLPQNIIYCEGSEAITLETEPGFSFYSWSTGQSGPNLNSIEVTTGGTYTVVVTDVNGCNAGAQTTVISSQKPEIIDVITTNFNQSNNTITIEAVGAEGIEYSLNNITFSDSNVFTDIPSGIYTAYVRDSLGCGVATQTVVVFDYPSYFTPNGDGINDFWTVNDLDRLPGTSIRVFDRFGILIKDLSLADANGWDGINANGKDMPTSDYWFTITLSTGEVIRGNFSLIR